MKVLDRLAIVVGALVLGSCGQDTASGPTQSLLASEDATFVCARTAEDGSLIGAALDACPPDPGGHALYSLVTQPETGEVAVLSLADCSDGAYCRPRVLDLEITQPGTTFLPVGGEPGSIVATPGGKASFVGVREAGREGVFALPTAWIGPRADNQAIRDLRTWPACRLPAAPGAMVMVVDAQRAGRCGGAPESEARSAAVDLSAEQDEPGRRELLVALPTRGEIWAIDAQELLNRKPGSFDECPVDNVLQLSTERPGTIEQRVPSDLSGDDVCAQEGTAHALVPSTFAAIPSDFALAEERLYVSDVGAPLIHVVDTADSCQLKETEPLLPVAFTQPGLVVPTRKVAVSPLSAKGERFVYAIDGSQSPLAGSVMVFDVSPESTDRTPLVRPRSGVILGEPPDRIRFTQEAADVDFAMRDYPAQDANGVALEGVRCSADPNDDSIATAYRPGTSITGATPNSLRGLFGFIVLQSGYLAIVDIDDLDAECRRTAKVNTSDVPDERGCANDPWSSDLTLTSTTYSVSDEQTCEIVQPHRVRSKYFYSHHDGGTAPALRAVPQLRSVRGISLQPDQTEQGRKNPKLLGVPLAGKTSSVFIAATELKTEIEQGPEHLELDPALAERPNLLLPETEPRAYNGSGSSFALAFEGPIAGFSAPVRVLDGDEQERAELDSAKRYASFSFPSNNQFCFSGVEDELVAAERGLELLSWDGDTAPTSADDLSSADQARLNAFAVAHSDYVSLTGDFPAEEDDYWQAAGASCGESYPWGDGTPPSGRRACKLIFKTGELEGRDPHRDFRIVRAFNDELLVEPRVVQSDRDGVLDALACCFPYTAQFEVRASNEWVFVDEGGVPNAVRPDPDTLACERRTCDPLLQANQGRVFEVACEDDSCRGIGQRGALDDTAPCVLPAGREQGALNPGELPDGCYLDGLTARLALYRGEEPSQRGMVYSWSTSGGYTPMLLSLYQNKGTTNPRRVNYMPQINNLVISDGGSVGVMFVSLRAYNGGPGFSFGTIL